MTLPSFLGIGVPKGGTSWLGALLLSHPDVYIPTKTRGIRYFDNHYDLGLDWYQEFFPPEDKASNYKAIGEITANYLYGKECPERIAGQLDQPKLILMLRHPVDRTWSNYKHTARLKNYNQSFEQYLEDFKGGIRFSLYSEDIKRYQAHFDPDQLLILLFDRVFNDIPAARKEIADYLEIDSSRFPEDAGTDRVNAGFIPRHRTIYAMVAKSQWITRNKQIYWPGQLAKKIGVKRLISAEGRQPEPMSLETRQRLLRTFDPDITELETLLQTDLSHWRS